MLLLQENSWTNHKIVLFNHFLVFIIHIQRHSQFCFFRLFYRYKRLLCTVDLTKDFFFSYSYNIMQSLQKNVCNRETGQVIYETMFVWNEFLTRGIRNHLKNTIWTVALVYGFFNQVNFERLVLGYVQK